MQTTGTLEEINIDYKTGKPKISFLINERDKLSDIEQLKGLKLKIEAKKYIKKRTTNANNYFWKLLQELCDLAEIDTIEEYKRRVKELGIFRRFKIETENIKTFEKMWTAQGIAWFCEIADTTYIENTEFKIINAYYGSSSFNSKQMARLIDGVVQDCKVYGIETNFYTSSGSKLNETARSYKTITLETKDLDYFKFVWFTDGCGWRSAKNNLKETFDVLEHLYNIADLESGIISKVLI